MEYSEIGPTMIQVLNQSLVLDVCLGMKFNCVKRSSKKSNQLQAR